MTDIRQFERQVVPWYSMDEWKDVFTKIYSEDPVLQKEAFNRMCVWKARVRNMPIGVESTMEILQVHLYDINNSELNYRLMCSSVLMRFLNHLSYLRKIKEHTSSMTMYSMATYYGIPDWIVNLRHEAAHGSNLPAVSLLQAASTFMLDWLYENYWMKEASEAHDHIVLEMCFPKDSEAKLRTLLNMWQACKIYKFKKFRSVGQIPNASLRSHLMSLYENEDIIIDSNLMEEGNVSVQLEDFLLPDGTSEHNAVKISKMLQYLIVILTNILPNRKQNNRNVNNLCARCLVECELFIPTKHHTFYTNGERLYGSVSAIWHDVLVAYHEANLMTELISELVTTSLKAEIPTKQLVAACWLSHLCLSLYMPHDDSGSIRNIKEDKLFVKYLMKGDHIASFMLKNILSNNLLYNINFSKFHRLKNDLLENTVNEVSLAPNCYTTIYLPSLLELLSPPMDTSAKEDVLQLVQMYTATKKIQPETDTVYTVESLNNIGENSEININSEFTSNGSQTMASESQWTMNHGMCGWGRCPLGLLPEN